MGDSINRYFIKISYNGTGYHGWQIQENGITVQEVLNSGLSTALQQNINVVGCGRTDTGVHATAFYAHFDTEKVPDTNFLYRINRLLPKDVAVYSILKVHAEAHARFDATSRTYQFKIHTFKNPFSINRSLFCNIPLDLKKMNEACEILKKHTDFTSFSKLHTQVKTNNCKILRAQWASKEKEIIFTIEADRFLRNMVRAIVGTMLDIGKNKISLTQFDEIIKSKDRCEAGMSVPACGLYLVKVNYPYAVE